MLSPIVERVREWTHQRKLKRLGFTEDSWRRHNDTRINRRADTITQYYHGYPWVFDFTSTRTKPFIDHEVWTDAYTSMSQWCETTCMGSWRDDIHRVVKQTGLTQIGDSIDWLETSEWVFNDIGGGDVLFFAFEQEQDAVLFALKWR